MKVYRDRVVTIPGRPQLSEKSCSVFAFWTYCKAGHVDFKLAMLVALGFAAGGWLGGMWAQHLSENVLRKGFAVLLVMLAAKMFFTR
jgi:uncharacterized membrane protein YfcA